MQVQQWILMTGKILQDNGKELIFLCYLISTSDIQIKSDINAIYHSL